MEHRELLEKGQIIDASTYFTQLGNWKITFSHAKANQTKLEKYGWLIGAQLPYSPDLAPSDYCCLAICSAFWTEKKLETEDYIRKALRILQVLAPVLLGGGIDKLPQLWRRVGNVVAYKFTRVTFGLNTLSPFLVLATVRFQLRNAVSDRRLENREISTDMGMNLRVFLSKDKAMNEGLPRESRTSLEYQKVLRILEKER
ncbi:unnamed protein product [Haemonchus placei]|uniref:Transmembrane protein n=1 Tax=Haemonchus placei TaxID=6290 RepID=A0A0N4WDI5_HAEPC|nr:unnamed protein product [Haemonchus placei]